ncbi:MAG: hypothetical protein AAFO17_15910 [Pseudomonadota bacterium]
MTHSDTQKIKNYLGKAFGCAADPAAPKTEGKREKPLYVTVRVTAEEKEKLRADAGNFSISDHVRGRLFGADVKPRKARGKHVIKDKQSLALILRTIGGAPFNNRMHRLILAHEENRLGLDRELADELRAMAWDITAIRNALVKALGLKPFPPPGKTKHVTFETMEDQ